MKVKYRAKYGVYNEQDAKKQLTASKAFAELRRNISKLQWWDKQLGSCSLSAATPAKLNQYRDVLANGKIPQVKQRSLATVNRYLAALSPAFTVAANEWCGHDSNC